MRGETSESEKRLPKDASESIDKESRKPLSERGRRAMQGETKGDLMDGTRPTDGHEFERWANSRYFEGKGRRLNVDISDNYKHLDQTSDSEIGLSKTRRTDIYLDGPGEIWEMKSGYEKGGINRDQLDNYQSMLDAGFVYERDKTNDKVKRHVNSDAGHDGVSKNEEEHKDESKRPVNNVYYLFATKAGAERNISQFDDHDIFVCYVDEFNNIQHLSH